MLQQNNLKKDHIGTSWPVVQEYGWVCWSQFEKGFLRVFLKSAYVEMDGMIVVMILASNYKRCCERTRKYWHM